MSAIYRAVKSTWRTVAPPSLHGYFFDGRGPVSKAVLAIKSKLENLAFHDDIYDAAYYANCSEEMERSAVGMAVAAFKPASVTDIGWALARCCNSSPAVASAPRARTCPLRRLTIDRSIPHEWTSSGVEASRTRNVMVFLISRAPDNRLIGPENSAGAPFQARWALPVWWISDPCHRPTWAVAT